MKTILLASLSMLLIMSCSNEGTQEEVEEANVETEVSSSTTTYTIDASTSKVSWKGNMLGMYAHNGSINVTEGTIDVEDGKAVGGSITMDMSTIDPFDENFNEQQTEEKLLGHLMSPDFFDVANNPTTTFTITGNEGENVTGQLTIRGTTGDESVTDVKITETDGSLTITGTLDFDRQNYGVAFSMGMPDKVISDKIVITLELKGSSAE